MEHGSLFPNENVLKKIQPVAYIGSGRRLARNQRAAISGAAVCSEGYSLFVRRRPCGIQLEVGYFVP